MFWCGVVLASLLLTVKLSGIGAIVDFEKEIQVSCVNNENDTKFHLFNIKYDPKMHARTYKFNQTDAAKIKELMGNWDKVNFFFLGHEDRLYSYSGRSFIIAREQMFNTNSVSCTISYDFLCGPDLMKYLQYFTTTVGHRIPKVVEMASTFIRHIVDSTDIKINLSGVYLTGFCLGGHIAGNVGYELKRFYKGQMVPTVWAFDPPALGFSHPSKAGEPRRVQKGDAQAVVVFHTSTLGVKKTIADVDIIVNESKDQPGCEKQTIGMFCDHYAAFILRELVVLHSDKLLLNKNGIPFAFAYDYSDQYPFDIINPALNKSGKYYLRTQAVFGAKS
ncbi:uncharacterized protein LOC116344212 [Contarinia nasturtii]|uniref:uncharacterized protein LOC116344212 n=1 Tax=Contarinia nasturtii TaxID=265458 RepID=UPI0012D48CAA|nr:uncharacterized protein LOC116344212 [Contarinia nasturtii]